MLTKAEILLLLLLYKYKNNAVKYNLYNIFFYSNSF